MMLLRPEVAETKATQVSDAISHDSRRRVTFLVALFKDGGTEKVLVQYLKRLDRGRYRLRLLIGIEYRGLEVYRSELPADVEVCYLVGESWLTRLGKKKLTGHLTVAQKIVECLVCEPLKRLLKRRRLSKLCNDQDLVVDFDTACRSLLGGVRVPKMAFFHYSVSRYCGGRQRKIARLERKFAVYERIVLLCYDMLCEASELWPSLAERLVVIYNPIDLSDVVARSLQSVAPPPKQLTF